MTDAEAAEIEARLGAFLREEKRVAIGPNIGPRNDLDRHAPTGLRALLDERATLRGLLREALPLFAAYPSLTTTAPRLGATMSSPEVTPEDVEDVARQYENGGDLDMGHAVETLLDALRRVGEILERSDAVRILRTYNPGETDEARALCRAAGEDE